MANGANQTLFISKKRFSESGGGAKEYAGPANVEAMAKEYDTAVVFINIDEFNGTGAQVDIIIGDSYDGESYAQISTNNYTTTGPKRITVTNFGGFLRVSASISGSATADVTFDAGITYKQT